MHPAEVQTCVPGVVSGPILGNQLACGGVDGRKAGLRRLVARQLFARAVERQEPPLIVELETQAGGLRMQSYSPPSSPQ